MCCSLHPLKHEVGFEQTRRGSTFRPKSLRLEGFSDFRAQRGAAKVNRPLPGRPPQRLRWHFSEKRAIGDRETSELPEAVVSDDTRDACSVGVRTKKRAPYEMH